tara:strand:- start:161 stop:559 length:399 start_codon:yes stop_codon:yes gene_type:complete
MAKERNMGKAIEILQEQVQEQVKAVVADIGLENAIAWERDLQAELEEVNRPNALDAKLVVYFENFREEDSDGNGVGSASYAEIIAQMHIEPDAEMWDALKQWAKREGFTDVTSSEICESSKESANETRQGSN